MKRLNKLKELSKEIKDLQASIINDTEKQIEALPKETKEVLKPLLEKAKKGELDPKELLKWL